MRLLGVRGSSSSKKSTAGYDSKRKRQMLPQRAGGESLATDYDVDETVLGSGAFGEVKKVRRRSSRKTHIVKIMEKAKIPDPTALMNEILIQSDLDHPHICRIFDKFETDAEVNIVMELCEGGDLSDAICDADYFAEADAHYLMCQVLNGVSYMHSRAICHRDLKPENVLLKEKPKAVPFTKNNVKIVDFGFAQEFVPGQRSLTTKCGTPNYLAPEILEEDTYDEKCDVWSLGVILYLFICGCPPFDGELDSDIFAAAKEGHLNFEDPIWSSVSPTAKLSIMQMCKVDPAVRFSASQAQKSPWISRRPEGKQEAVLDQDMVLKNMRQFKRGCRFRKAAAHLIAHSLPDKELKDLRCTFEAMDTDGDGMLSVEELQKGLGGLDQSTIVDLFNEVDTDGDGQVEWTEFLSVLATRQQQNSKCAMIEAFEVFDADGDGKISLAELTQMMRQQGIKDCSSLQEDLKRADTNGDGSVDFEEFENFMTASLGASPCKGAREAEKPLGLQPRRASGLSSGLCPMRR